MNGRVFSVFVLFIAFIVSLYGVASIPAWAWRVLSSWETATIVLGILVSFATLLLAYWVCSDYDAHKERFEDLEDRLHRIESIADEKALAERLAKAGRTGSTETGKPLVEKELKDGTWQCSRCNRINSAKAKFCTRCGEERTRGPRLFTD